MKWRKITLLVEAVKGEEHVDHSEAAILFSPPRGVLVNEKPLPHNGFVIGVGRFDAGFLSITFQNITEEVFNEFMEDETVDDVLDGTGLPYFTGEGPVDSADDESAEPDGIMWHYGANIVLPVHDLELRVVTPVEA